MRLIDADALDVVGTIIPKDADTKSYVMGMEYILNKIDSMPTIEERKKGKWLDGPEGEPVAFEKDAEGHCPVGSCWCSECGTWLVGSDEYYVYGDYCPNCGARMDA